MKLSILLLPLLAACSAREPMIDAPGESEPPGTDEAKVVVYRPTFKNSTKPYAFLDDEEVLGFALSGAWFEARVTPGNHFFLLHGVTSTAIRATLEAGKTYYLRVDSIPKFLHLQLRLTPLTPEMKEYDEIEKTLSGLRRQEPIDHVLERYSTSRADQLEEVLSLLQTEGLKECAILSPEAGK